MKMEYPSWAKCCFKAANQITKTRQLGNRKKSYVVSDDIETGVLNKIPLWMFGFMY